MAWRCSSVVMAGSELMRTSQRDARGASSSTAACQSGVRVAAARPGRASTTMTTAVVMASALVAAFAVASGPFDASSTPGGTRTRYPTARASAGSAAATARSRPWPAPGSPRPPPTGARPEPGERQARVAGRPSRHHAIALIDRSDAHQARPPAAPRLEGDGREPGRPAIELDQPVRADDAGQTQAGDGQPCGRRQGCDERPGASPIELAGVARRPCSQPAEGQDRGAGDHDRHQGGGLGGDGVGDRCGGHDDALVRPTARPRDPREGSSPRARRAPPRQRRAAPPAAPGRAPGGRRLPARRAQAPRWGSASAGA